MPAGDATVDFLFMLPPKSSDLPASRASRLPEPHLKQRVQEGVFAGIRTFYLSANSNNAA
jgi:hypothetical protein